jgi:predicted RNase H-like HicB family nuclease
VGAVFDSRICRPNGRSNNRLDRPGATPAAQPERYPDSEQTGRVAPASYTGCPGGPEPLMAFKVETEREDDGRWLAEVVEVPGVLAYGDTQQAALSRVQALALRVVAERLEHGEAGPELLSISFNAA